MSARSEGALTLTMKTSAMTMNTGANSTGRNHGLPQKVDLGISCVWVIWEFNGWPPVVCEFCPGVRLAFQGTVCDDVDPGTREGVILVSKAPPKRVSKRSGNGSAPAAEPDGAPRRAELADFLRTRRE